MVLPDKRERMSFLRGWRGSGPRRGAPVTWEYIDTSLKDRSSADNRWLRELAFKFSWDATRRWVSSFAGQASSAALNFDKLISSFTMSRIGPSEVAVGTFLLLVCPKSFSPNRSSRQRQLLFPRVAFAPWANKAVRLSRRLRARRRQHQMKTMKMKAQPSAMRRICHHANGLRRVPVGVIVVVRPVMLGRGGDVPVPDAGGTTTRSDKQAPSPGMTVVFCWQVAATQVPSRKTWLLLEHARQLLGPCPEQDEQLESHVWQDDDVGSKNWDLLQIGRHRPFRRTGREGGQLLHWLNEPPEQVAQSGWQLRQELEEEKVLEGQLETHFPLKASWLEVHVRQNVDEPEQVPQLESQAVQVKLSWGDRNVPEGQLSRHFPLERTEPGRQPVHCSWSTVEATLKFGILHDVHFAPQATGKSLVCMNDPRSW